jgi:hypothetical protein
METKQPVTINEIQNWLNLLKFVSIINISIVCVYIVLYYNSISKIQSFYFILVAIYVLVCAIRSLWPRLDTKCTCVFNNKISSPLVGRSLATIAEMAFIILIVMITNTILNIVQKSIGNTHFIETLKILNLMIIPTIFIAQLTCWYGITTKNYFWEIIEGALWTYSIGILFIVYFYIYIKTVGKNISNNRVRFITPFLPYILIITAFHLLFMFLNYMPLMFKNNLLNKNHIPFWQGLSELSCNKVSKKYKDWKKDIPWLTGYFSISVWVSILILFWHHKLEMIR